MLTLEEVKRRLEPMNLSHVAFKADINVTVLYRTMNGSTTPKYETVKKLSDWLEGIK